jgi:hypothetical protein
MVPSGSGGDLLRCSFCGKNQKQIKKLITGALANICNECVEPCVELCAKEALEWHISGLKIIADPLNETEGATPSSVNPVATLAFNPVFGPKIFPVKRDTCFYLGPFKEPFNVIYKDHVIPVLARNGFSVTRADEIFSTGPIVDDIWEGINSAEFLIADLSGKNPNVMYEVGMAHTVGKRVLLISQSIDDIPFDLRHWRCLIYEYTPPGCQKLERGISESTQYFRRNRASMPSMPN